MALSRLHIASTVAYLMETVEHRVLRAKGDQKLRLAGQVEGMDMVGVRLGVRCYCKRVPRVFPPTVRCDCDPISKSRRDAMGIEGVPPFRMSLAGCRDKRGKFVPVNQCTGRREYSPAAKSYEASVQVARWKARRGGSFVHELPSPFAGPSGPKRRRTN